VKKNNGYHVQCWTNRNQENLLFWKKLCFKSPMTKQDYFLYLTMDFLFFCVKIPLFGWWFHVSIPNLMKFQVPCICISLCAEKLRLNYFQGLGNTLLCQRCDLRLEEAFHNRQISGLSTFSLALSFILYRYNVPFLCIMCHMLRCNLSETVPLLTHNCW
jgi:hypothetical protein